MPNATEQFAGLTRSRVHWLQSKTDVSCKGEELPWLQALASLAQIDTPTAIQQDNQQRVASLQHSPHRPVGLWIGNSPLHLALLQLARLAGISIVPIPLSAPDETLGTMCTQADLAAILCDRERLQRWRSAAAAGVPLPPAIDCDKPWAGPAITADWLETKLQGREEPAPRLLFTSGTNGRPKAVRRASTSDQFRIRQFIDRFALHPNIRHIIAGPLYHSGPAIFATTSMAMHADIVVLDHFDPQRVVEVAEQGPPASLFLVPTQLALIEKAVGPVRFASFLHSLARLWVAGSRFEPAFKQRVARLSRPGSLFEFFGSTETGTISIQDRDSMLALPASVGKPAPGISVQILDEHGQPCPTGTPGYLYVHSPMTIQSYLDPAEPLQRSGMHICIGDRGWQDAAGNLYLQGRDHEMMISGGVNVYPAEVEDGLARIPGIQASLAFAVPDPVWGDRVEALVVASGNTLSANDVLEKARQVLPQAARPRAIHFVDALPVGTTGKPDRKLAGKLTANLI